MLLPSCVVHCTRVECKCTGFASALYYSACSVLCIVHVSLSYSINKSHSLEREDVFVRGNLPIRGNLLPIRRGGIHSRRNHSLQRVAVSAGEYMEV
jgi:hypothetical protein